MRTWSPLKHDRDPEYATHTHKIEGYPAGCHFWLSFQLSTEAEGQRGRETRGWKRKGGEGGGGTMKAHRETGSRWCK